MKISDYLSWTARLGLLLVIISLLLYILNLVLFQDPKDTYFYLSIDMAFLPIEVLFVVLVIESVISNREKRILLEKLNMVIGTFSVKWEQIYYNIYQNMIKTQILSGKI